MYKIASASGAVKVICSLRWGGIDPLDSIVPYKNTLFFKSHLWASALLCFSRVAKDRGLRWTNTVW